MKKILILIFLFYSSICFAQFETSIELRNRVEFRDGYKTPLLENQVPNFAVFQRTRPLFTYKSEKLKIHLAPQDIRTWGDDINISKTGVGDNPSFALYEAYAEYKFDTINYLKIGRQELKYDNQRLLSIRNWGNTGLTYDAITFKTNLKNYNIHFGLSWNSIEAYKNNYYYSTRIKSQNYIWINKKFKKLQLSAIQLFTGRTNTDTSNNIYFKQTSGIFFNYKANNFIIEGDGYYQYGKNNSNQRVDAYLIGLDLKYYNNYLDICLGGTYISGDKDINDRIDKTFDLGYGTMHRFLGLIDYFNIISRDTKNGGLFDTYIYFNYMPTKNIKFKETFHYFKLAQNNLNYKTDKLGIENDFLIEFKINKNFIFECGYLIFSPTETMNLIKNTTNAKLQTFIYMQLYFKIDSLNLKCVK